MPDDAFEANAVDAAPPKPPLPGGAIDVTDKAAIDALKTGSPDERHLAEVAENARASYGKLITSGARVVVNSSAGNGGKPVITLIPPEVLKNPGGKYEVQLHYHGMGGNAAVPDAATHHPDRILKAMQGPPPKVFVLPEAANANGKPTSAFFPDWTNVKNTRTTADDGLRAAGLSPTSSDHSLTVSAHSAGGRALAWAAHEGGLSADRLEIEDCLYGLPDKNAASAKSRHDLDAPPAREAIKQWLQTDEGKKLKEISFAMPPSPSGKVLEPGEVPAGIKRTIRQPPPGQHNDASLF